MTAEIVKLVDYPDILLAVWEYIRTRNKTVVHNNVLFYIPLTEKLKHHYPHLTKPFYIGEGATQNRFEILSDKIEWLEVSYCQAHLIKLHEMTMTNYKVWG